MNSVNGWFFELNQSPTDVVDSVYTLSTFDIGHFLVMSYDQNVRVGCAAMQYESQVPDQYGINKFTRITCNFFKVPYLGTPLYAVGNPCDGCPDTCDWESLNAGLCIVDPTTFANEYRFNDTV